jgi:glucose-1-phosphate thymidylyltransferase
MICVVLAAGYATRLYPITKNFPKPLLRINKKTIIDWLLDDIDSSGRISKYVVVSNHRYINHFNKWAEDKKLSAPITVIDDGTTDNSNRLGAVKDIKFAVDSLNLDDNLLVIAGDNVLDFSICHFIDYFDIKKNTCIMRYFEPSIEMLKKGGVLKVNDDDLVTDMKEKPENPESNWLSPPFYIYAKVDVSLIGKGIEEGCGTDAPGSFIAWLCKKRSVYAMEMPGRRYDIGDIKSYEEVKAVYKGIEG